MKNHEQAPSLPDFSNEDVVRRILESGSPEEIEQLRAAGNLDQATIDLRRHFAQLRKRTIDETFAETIERAEHAPFASDEELNAGVYREMIEPHVRDAVFRLREKGYGTKSSGFSIENRQTILFDAPYFSTISVPSSVCAELEAEGVTIEIEPEKISLLFKNPTTIEQMKTVWDRIEESLPDRGAPALPTMTGAAIQFREKQNDQEFLRRAAEKMETKYYEEYLDDLGLIEDALKDKHIVDIGAGTRIFAGRCARTGVASEVFSVEPNVGTTYPYEEKVMRALWSKEIRKHIDSRTVRGLRDDLPFKDATIDVVLVHGAMPGSEASLDNEVDMMRTEIDRSFAEIMRVLKPKGEARLYPFYTNEHHSYRTPWKEAIDQVLERLSHDDAYIVRVELVRERRIEGSSFPTETIARIVIQKRR